jgi:hypothetical protein
MIGESGKLTVRGDMLPEEGQILTGPQFSEPGRTGMKDAKLCRSTGTSLGVTKSPPLGSGHHHVGIMGFSRPNR